MVDGEVVHLRVPAEQVAFLLVNHQLLHQLAVFGHVQVESSRGFARPCRGVIAGGGEGLGKKERRMGGTFYPRSMAAAGGWGERGLKKRIGWGEHFIPGQWW